MTQHDQIIAICIIAIISVPLGTFITIKTINKLSRPPVNTLIRRNDIELQEVIDPIQHINVRDIDLSSLPQYPQAMVNHIPINGNYPPRYSQLTNNFINCPLELDSWDLFPLLIFLSIFIAFIIFKYFKTNVLIPLTLFFILKFGLLMNSLYAMCILIPFSFFEIDFRDSFEWKFDSYRDKHKISYLKLQTLTHDLISLLNSLNDDKNYSMSLSFISSYKEWKDNKENIHPLFIDNAIIINKESDPILITQFIMNSLNDKGLFINNWLFKDDSINRLDPVILTVTVGIKIDL